MSVLRHNAELMTLSDLKRFLDKTVTLRMTDGEIAKVRVRVVGEEYDDLIVDVLETSSPARYRDPRLRTLLQHRTSSLLNRRNRSGTCDGSMSEIA
jgi:hypothetical protein